MKKQGIVAISAALIILVTQFQAFAESAGVNFLSDAVTFTADFDTVGFSSGGQKWSGWKNNGYTDENDKAGTYSDFISVVPTDGIGVNGGKGVKITYSAASVYSGEQFIGKPTNWDMTYADELKYIEFDAKGKAKLSFNLETDKIINGTHYECKFDIDTTELEENNINDGWKHYKMPVSMFQKGGAAVSVADIVGISFKAGESGPVATQTDMSKYSDEYLESVAKTAEAVIDNLGITGSENGIIVEPSDKTYTADFDIYKFPAMTQWDGRKNDDGSYKDYIQGKYTALGMDGSGFKIEYSAATSYSGELFLQKPANWNVSEQKCIEFDAKGRGKLKVNLEKDKYLNGTKYGYKIPLEINSDEEWSHYRLLISDFAGTDNVKIAASDIVGISFTPGETYNLSDSVIGAMTADELDKVACKGSVVIDNFAVTDIVPQIEEITLNNGNDVITSLSGMTDETVLTANAVLSDNIPGANIIAAVYDSDGRFYTFQASDIVEDNKLSVNITVPDPQNMSVKVMLWEGMNRPLGENSMIEIR